jgi:hypothetical protein
LVACQNHVISADRALSDRPHLARISETRISVSLFIGPPPVHSPPVIKRLGTRRSAVKGAKYSAVWVAAKPMSWAGADFTDAVAALRAHRERQRLLFA